MRGNYQVFFKTKHTLEQIAAGLENFIGTRFVRSSSIELEEEAYETMPFGHEIELFSSHDFDDDKDFAFSQYPYYLAVHPSS